MTTAALILQLLLQYGPAVAKEAQALLSNTAPTQADWDALFTLASKPYSSYVVGTTT